MNANITLTKVMVGIANPFQDHVYRNPLLNISNESVDQLYSSRMGNANAGVMPSVVRNVALQSGELNSQATGVAYIEDGWGSRRGMASLTFRLSSNQIYEEELVVLGYLTGGEMASLENGLDENTFFVPVKTWMKVIRSTADAFGLPEIKTTLNNCGQLALNNNGQGESLVTIRPTDVVDGVVSLVAMSDVDNSVFGGEVQFGGPASSMLENTGLINSNMNNLNNALYAEKLLKSCIKANSDSQMSDAYTAISNASLVPDLKELSATENAFITVMRRHLGMGVMQGFSGFTLGEINEVFINLPDVLIMQLVDESSFKVNDARVDSNAFGSSSRHEVLANEAANLMTSLLVENRLMSVRLIGHNNTSEAMTNSSGVACYSSEAVPLIDNDDIISLGINIQEQFAQMFFTKISPMSLHARTIVNINIHAFLFGKTVVEIAIDGNLNDTRRYTFSTCSDNRSSPIISNGESGHQLMKNVYSNLTQYFNL